MPPCHYILHGDACKTCRTCFIFSSDKNENSVSMSIAVFEPTESSLLVRARELLQRAKDGIAKQRRKKNKQVIGLTNLLVNAHSLYLEEEIHLFIRAAEAFRICQQWMDAAESYSQAGWLLGNDLKQQEEGAILYTEAGLCAMRFGIDGGERYLSKSNRIDLFHLLH